MFRLINSLLQACSLQVKSQDAVHTLGSQCVYISEIFKADLLPRRGKLAKYITYFASFALLGKLCGLNISEDGYLLVETCSLHISWCNKNSCADLQISITIRI